MVEPWDRTPETKPWRLGMKLHENGLGWAAIAVAEKRLHRSGVAPVGPDVVATIIERYRAIEAEQPDDACGGIDLYRYANTAVFADSRAAEEGMSLGEHSLMIAQVAAGLRAAGIRVDVKVVQ